MINIPLYTILGIALSRANSIIYFVSYLLFYRFSGAHTKPTSDSKYDPSIEHQNHLFYRLVRYLENRKVEKDKIMNMPSVSSIPVPQLEAENTSILSFKFLSDNKTRPVVIRGLISGSSAVEKWSPEFFSGAHYGDTQLLTLFPGKQFKNQNAYTSFNQSLDCQYVSLKDSIFNMVNNAEEKIYINNVTELFSKHSELIDDLELNRINLIDGSINEKTWLKVNMFMGGPGTGSSLHCAVGGNFFFNVKGRKRWILIHPQYSKFLKTTPSPNFAFVISGYDMENVKEHTFLNKIPRYEVVLEPGDVLYIPPWWWHYVKNETDFTIGCAVRDHTVYWQSLKNNLTYMLMSPYLYTLNPLVLYILQKLKGREFLLHRSMVSDRHIMQHLTGKLL